MAINKFAAILSASFALALAAPAIAQDAAPADVPTCSATVTDKCISRGGGGHHAMRHGKHHGKHHGRHHHHHGHHRHHHHKK